MQLSLFIALRNVLFSATDSQLPAVKYIPLSGLAVAFQIQGARYVVRVFDLIRFTGTYARITKSLMQIGGRYRLSIERDLIPIRRGPVYPGDEDGESTRMPYDSQILDDNLPDIDMVARQGEVCTDFRVRQCVSTSRIYAMRARDITLVQLQLNHPQETKVRIRDRLIISIGLVMLPTMSIGAEFICQSDVPTVAYTNQEQEWVDTLWHEVLQYLDAYADVLDNPSGRCLDSAEATIETYDLTRQGWRQSRCIKRYRDVELMVKHLRAVLAEPDKAKRCFDPQKNYEKLNLYTPNAEMQTASAVASWLDRPLLTDYYTNGMAIGSDGHPVRMPEATIQAGLEFSTNFIPIVSKVDTSAHWKRDVSYKGLTNLWAAVGWLPMYSGREDAMNERFRGSYAYGEVMGPFGLLRIQTIDQELVGAEIGMTAQLLDSSYPIHYHHAQEVYVVLTAPECLRQNQYMILHWDNEAVEKKRVDNGWQITVDGSSNRWRQWFRNQDPQDNWLAYIERNDLHAFFLKDACNRELEDTGLVTVWARTTSRDNNQTTRLCRPARGSNVKNLYPWTRVICELEDWQP